MRWLFGLGRQDVQASLDASMHNALEQRFPPFLNEQSLRSAIESVCADFGEVTYLKILPASGGANFHCACFLRLDSAAAEAALKSKLHVIEFAGDLHFFADVNEKWTGPTM
jgi:hypothetical protein